MKRTERVNKVVEDQEGNLVVAIRKYNWIECLFHSIYGFFFLVFLTIIITLVVYSQWIWAIAAFVICMFCWAKSWLNANDRLKGHIYTVLLEQHLLENHAITAPFIVKRYYSGIDSIKCVDEKGEVKEYKVEFIQEELPLYVVKIMTKG